MLKSKLKILTILFLAFILVSSISFATEVPDEVAPISETSEEEVVTSAEDSWVKKDLFICDDDVVVEDIVDGNAFIIGKNVTIRGEIGGDLFVLAEKVNIDGGYIYSSLFTCANEVTINGIVYDIYGCANHFSIGENAFIYRDLKVTGNTIQISGKIRRNAYLSAANYDITDTALIGGNLEYSKNEDITIPENVVTGEVTRTAEKNITETKSISSVVSSYLSDLAKTLVYTLVVVLLLLWLAPKFINRVGEMSIAKDFISLGIGLASIIAVIVVGVFLIISIIGIPLFFSALLVLAILASISFSITSIFFGNLFAKLLKLESRVKFVLITLASSIVLWILCQIPFIGPLVSFLITIFGIGAVLVNIVWKKEKSIVETKE